MKLSHKKDYHSLYNEAHGLVDDVTEAIAGGRAVSECPRVGEFLRNNKFSEEIINNLSSAGYNRRAYDIMRSNDGEQAAARFLDRLDREEKKTARRKRRRIVYGLTGASAAVILLAIMLSVSTGSTGEPDPTPRQITLTLADGRTIVLDDTNLIEEAEASIRNDHGSLVVERKAEEISETPSPSLHTLNVSHGCQYDITLEDGTRVWLNSGSSLRFPAVFGEGGRMVFVEGEAYFEVSPDSGRPFRVETYGQTLTVLGTSFNIYSYRDEAVTRTTLLSGSVSIRSGDNEVLLKPNQSSELNRNNSEFSVKTVDAGAVAEWRNGVFVFDDNTLEQVLMKVSRWYDVEIEYDEDKARAFVYKGNLPRYDSIGEMLESIEMTGSVKFRKSRNGHIMTM